MLAGLGLLATTSLGTAALAQDFNAEPPNRQGQSPAFEGQTRAPVLADETQLNSETIVDGLQNPWGMALLPDGSWLVTERLGALRHVGADGTLSDPISGTPTVDTRGQGGLLDVAIADDFAETRRIWLSFAAPREEGKTATAVATGTLSTDGSALENMEIIFQQQPAWDSTLHYGSRLVFAPDGALFVTTGERSVPDARPLAQDLGTHLGKVLRLDPAGGPAADNPTIDGALPEIWSYGHRNMQGATIGPDGALWTIEHGPAGGDELNRPEAGLNYGWPLATYGTEYSGEIVGAGNTTADGTEQPLYYWDPIIAPSGLVFYDGDMFPDWQGSLLTGGLRGQALVRLELDGTSVTGEARYLQDQGRIRDVAIAPDGAIMILTDAEDGALIRVTPAQ
nr:PQQ-dependent sugar dehydrogenase [Ketogulonicigenium robustum]